MWHSAAYYQLDVTFIRYRVATGQLPISL